ncbi:6-phosphogluconate dehydrogenase C-terminal domain-like protein [Teratosphaeria nubilosa]|uniref:3-hydroxyisobutyrate dehydrogenase n=1 Tax=Teratosphaeria nubilosa TaxID=161662 RepID=A0A6G1L2T2_9PEZI|nr:6-phosphogluconate dehydrogenase C-terminal domain-like protein [Teratosphaeria nubilosa]
MLPNGKIVKEALLGEIGIARALKPGTIIIDTSSSSPFDTIALGKKLAQHSLELIEAPITQTYMHATDHGESTLMVGSDKKEVYEKASPVLRTMGSYVFLMGPLGHGHAMKTINNYVMASSLVALCDSVIAGQKYGLDPQQMIDVLNVGTGVNFQTLDPFRRDALTKRYSSGFGLALLVKDLGITQEFMVHNKVETELPGLLRAYLSEALGRVDPMADHTAALEGWEKKSGISVKRTEKVKDIPREDFEHRLRGLNRKE